MNGDRHRRTSKWEWIDICDFGLTAKEIIRERKKRVRRLERRKWSAANIKRRLFG